MAIWSVAVEGPSDEAVVRAMLQAVGHQCGVVYGLRGKGWIDAKARNYCNAGQFSPWIVLRDLDCDADCAPSLLRALAPGGAAGMFRVAVRAVEAWLLADRKQAAEWLAVPLRAIPTSVESLDDPKQTLLKLARASRRRRVRDDMIPAGTARIGPGYVDQVRGYCAGLWRPSVAADSAPSLHRCLSFLRRFPGAS